MQQLSTRPVRVASQNQQRLLVVISGLALALAQFALFNLNNICFLSEEPILIGLQFLLYFLVPIPLSFYISRQTGVIEDGYWAGGMTGCIAALFTTLGALVSMLFVISPGNGGWLIVFFLLLVFVNIFGFLIAFAGAFVGGKLGIAVNEKCFTLSSIDP